MSDPARGDEPATTTTGDDSPVAERGVDSRNPSERDADGQNPSGRGVDSRNPSERDADGQNSSERGVDSRNPSERDADGQNPAEQRGSGLGHVHLKVRDLSRSVDFYTELLPGLSLREQTGSYAFLSAGDAHHELALQEVEAARGPGPESDAVGLYHAAWEVPDTATLTVVYERLDDRDVAVSPVDHGISKALYFTDPDGNGVEVYVDTRAENDRQVWHGHDEPFDPTAL